MRPRYLYSRLAWRLDPTKATSEGRKIVLETLRRGLLVRKKLSSGSRNRVLGGVFPEIWAVQICWYCCVAQFGKKTVLDGARKILLVWQQWLCVRENICGCCTLIDHQRQSVCSSPFVCCLALIYDFTPLRNVINCWIPSVNSLSSVLLQRIHSLSTSKRSLNLWQMNCLISATLQVDPLLTSLKSENESEDLLDYALKRKRGEMDTPRNRKPRTVW